MFDASEDHVLAAIGRRVRAAAGRGTYLVAENEPQETRLVRARRREAGSGSTRSGTTTSTTRALVALTGHNEAYYTDYRGTPQELLSAIRWGFLYQGQRYKWQKQRRGTPALDLAAERFVLYLENHDQVANSGLGARLSTLTAPDKLRAMTALLLLAPGTPMLFQGQEFGSTRPFVYFADHDDELARAVAKGRREFLAQFPSLADPDVQARIPDPAAPETFAACKLDWSERDRHAQIWELHRDLLRLRREDPAFAAQDLDASPHGGARRRGDAAPLSRAPRAIGCCSSIWGPTFTSTSRPSRCSRRRAAPAGGRSGRARTRATAVEGRPPSRPTTGFTSPDMPRWSWPRRCARERATRTPRSPGAGRAIGWRRGDAAEALVSREWLLTNGLGGYACGTVGGVLTRRYHSLLVAALPAPAGRTTMLNQLGETLRLADGTVIPLGGLEPGDGPLLLPEALVEFRLDNGRPVWRFEQAGVMLEKRIVLTHHQNTTRIVYRLLEGSAPATLVLEPAVDFRGHDDRVDRGGAATDYTIAAGDNGVRIARADGTLPPLHLTARTRARSRPLRAAAPRRRPALPGRAGARLREPRRAARARHVRAAALPPARRRS